MIREDQTLGNAIRARREELEMNQAVVARILHTTQGNLSRWERDLTEPKDTETYRSLAAFLEVSLTDLAGLLAASTLRRMLKEIAVLESSA
jgi:transcriptional regulator with XRE-family HTH domain